jgi:hypothetical protein
MDETRHVLTNAEAKSIASELKKAAYEGDVRTRNARQRLTDEQIKPIFEAIDGLWLQVPVLQKQIGSVITIHDPKDGKSAISSHYLSRLKALTGRRWRQKSGTDEKGNSVIKVYSHKG